MTGFLGQKFDFTGDDGEWYALIADANIHANMRVSAPVHSLPEITYITGLSVMAADAEGVDRSIVISVKATARKISRRRELPSCVLDTLLSCSVASRWYPVPSSPDDAKYLIIAGNTEPSRKKACFFSRLPALPRSVPPPYTDPPQMTRTPWRVPVQREYRPAWQMAL